MVSYPSMTTLNMAGCIIITVSLQGQKRKWPDFVASHILAVAGRAFAWSSETQLDLHFDKIIAIYSTD